MSKSNVRAMSILSVWLGLMMLVYWLLAFVSLDLNPLEWSMAVRSIYALFALCWLALLVIIDAQVNQ